MEGQAHPYVPTDLKLEDYVPVFLSQSTILAVFGTSSLVLVSLVWFISGSSRKAAKIDRWLMCWWAFTGLTHIILEGYFVFSPEFYKDKTSFYLAEVWKEYSKGDSRYAARDSAVVAVEGLTAVLEGPASLLAVYAIAAGKSYSYILQFAISLGQLYGTAVYFLTPYLDGYNYASSPYYHYAYYIGANASWVVIPSLICIRSWKKICAAFQVQGQRKTKSG
ncbi:probable 3-beta-hydroxysteroid-Delta(8),Delta(7)-isomerase [Ricinus communis]|uniref:Sterol isomerase, putative n=1 Tax=Ricinus communis TaxID=3988 RepID=B9RG26_RICCO|nr:probable 3-beta-hydroxysteroid-Delta(8),Delta(7)-isomerase [Ricinus communis]EEF50147.1 sterol isomerase, putative [Ricinus communis]|eukprot:XP_002512695.1 probable 3-beta-hydroxysteroid-Delta(8),Delta(7)-isomerase [Ricinus communis]